MYNHVALSKDSRETQRAIKALHEKNHYRQDLQEVTAKRACAILRRRNDRAESKITLTNNSVISNLIVSKSPLFRTNARSPWFCPTFFESFHLFFFFGTRLFRIPRYFEVQVPSWLTNIMSNRKCKMADI